MTARTHVTEVTEVTHVIAGIGLRQQASVQALRQALSAALAEAGHQSGATLRLRALASAADKCEHPALLQLARESAVPLRAVALDQLPLQAARPSAHVPARYGARSVAEAAALAAAGHAAVLAGGRHVSADGSATAAIAIADPSSEPPTP